MPGRLAIYDDTQFKHDVSSLIKNDLVQTLQPYYNIAPTHAIPVLLNNGTYIKAHFGFFPPWANDRKTIHVNARNESIYEKSTFREAYKQNRCIVLVNGYYEWIDSIPYFIHSSNNDYFAVAGIWDEYYDKELNQNILNVAMITCEPNEKIAKIHHRMPVILDKKDYKTWLHNNDINSLNKLFKIYPSELMTHHEVSKNINKVGFDNNSCIKEYKNKLSGQLSLF